MRLTKTVSSLILLVFFGSTATRAHSQQTPPDIPFKVEVPLKMPPEVYMGEVAGVAVNSKHHVFVYTRTGADDGTSLMDMRSARIFEFGPDGRFVKEIGKNLYSKAWAHAVRVDKDDNIWLVDNGSDEITKLSPDYKVQFVLGRRDEAVGERKRPHDPKPPNTNAGWFNEPTDVAWDPQGNIFVSDGYVNSRVHKFDKDGNIVKSVGTDKKSGGPGEFNLPHAIAVDNHGFVYVADRSNGRIQILDNDLNYVREIKFQPPFPEGYVANIPDFGGPARPGTQPPLSPADTKYRTLWPNTLCITPGATQYIYVNDMFPGRVYKFTLDGKLLGQFGISGYKPGQFGWIHALACVSENEIWTGELLTWRVQKFTLQPASAQTIADR
jgi:hypothetical protein